ncbi:IclR family transcriptional regulator [Halostagnicola sp. A-GB9-2]|uniref:IclR family transcriptional regulator n=1 Tax=Halostagnicola sp. A-GB9-2 TaxID=3048066 RepID=UPI0024C0BA8A|nr:IclR family transcriptional regulator [Halostagnicola sp. A-GB9-2]MDJ1434360.1 IclR family transcriptional regulator [Halostagnicola sp. A-GB9-2]
MTRETSSLTTIHRAFEILELLWELDGAGPTELANRMDLPDSTVYDYLRSLSDTKYVTRENGTYFLSSYFLTIGGKMKHRNRLFQVAKPEMKRIAAETNELVGLTIENDGIAVVFHQEEGKQALSLGTHPGAATPLHTLATGKAILAYLPDERVDEIIAERGLEQRTDHTITDVDRLKDELAEIRDNGYAVDWNEQVTGMGMASVPILIDDQVLGSFGIVVPTGRIQDEQYQQELLRKLQEMEETVTINYQFGE